MDFKVQRRIKYAYKYCLYICTATILSSKMHLFPCLTKDYDTNPENTQLRYPIEFFRVTCTLVSAGFKPKLIH